jgi:signal transduction histidine kinase
MRNRSKTFASKLLWLFTATVMVCWLISSILLGSILQNYTQQVRTNQWKWLNLYSRTFVQDIRVGNTLAIRTKMRMLVDSESYLSATLTVDGIKTTERSHTKANLSDLSWFEGRILALFAPPKFSIPLQDAFQVKWGEFEVIADPHVFYKGVAATVATYIIAHLGLLLIFLGLLILVLRRQIQPLQLLTRSVSFFANSERGSPEDLEKVLKNPVPGASEELVVLKSALEKAVGKLLQAQNHLNAERVQTELTKIALQVAHDIRSPLCVLKMMTQEISRSVSSDQLSLVSGAIDQIQSIAEDLLCRYRKARGAVPANADTSTPPDAPNSTPDRPGLSVELIAKHLDSSVNSARMVMLGKKDFTVSVAYAQDAEWSFAEIEPVHFKRALCNLIKNAVEAVPEGGQVQVSMVRADSKIRICIEDNGPGVSEPVIAALGSGAPLTTKLDGHGLGLQFAKDACEAFQGHLHIDRSAAGGAKLTVELPSATMPKGLAAFVDVTDAQDVVVLDDDPAMHAYWKERFKSPHTPLGMRLHCFSKPGELFRWMNGVGPSAREARFLIDLELQDPNYDGIGILQQLDLWQNSILVSAREERLVGLAAEYEPFGIRILPKSLLTWVPIRSCVS